MTTEDRRRWDTRWAQTAPGTAGRPSSWLSDNLPLLPQGRVLDVAAGRGRNVPLLLTRAAQVIAVDVSIAGLREIRDARAHAVCMDLDRPGFRAGTFDGILCASFLDRRLFPLFADWLRPGGVLVFDTFLIDQRDIGHPRNPAHLLAHNELLAHLRDWRVLRYREGEVVEEDARSYRASAVAVRPG